MIIFPSASTGSS